MLLKSKLKENDRVKRVRRKHVDVVEVLSLVDVSGAVTLLSTPNQFFLL